MHIVEGVANQERQIVKGKSRKPSRERQIAKDKSRKANRERQIFFSHKEKKRSKFGDASADVRGRRERRDAAANAFRIVQCAPARRNNRSKIENPPRGRN